MEKPKDDEENTSQKIGVCVECKVRNGDSNKKKLYQCPHCGRWFCEKHIEPRIATTRGAIEQIKDPILRDKILDEWRKPDGHPDVIWTRKYFEDLRKKQEEEREKFWEAVKDLDKIKKKEEYNRVKELIETPRKVIYRKEEKFKITLPISKIVALVVIISFLAVLIFGIKRTHMLEFTITNLSKNNTAEESLQELRKEIIIVNTTKMVTPDPLQLCKQNAEEEIKALRLKYPVDFTHKFILSNEFYSIEEAEEFARKYVTFSFSNICRDQKPKKIMVLIYELRYANPISIGAFDVALTISKESIAFYCDENGKILKVGTLC